MGISRKNVWKRAFYKSRDSKEYIDKVNSLLTYIQSAEEVKPLLTAAIISDHTYRNAGVFQRFQAIDKIWTPLCIVASKMRSEKGGGAWRDDLDIVRQAAVLLADGYGEGYLKKDAGGPHE